jgi:hypothetical protein
VLQAVSYLFSTPAPLPRQVSSIPELLGFLKEKYAIAKGKLPLATE